MKFLLMIKPDEKADLSQPAYQRLMEAIGKLTVEMLQSGKIVDTGGITPLDRTTKLRVAGGKVIVTDGPFTEARELIGGYAIVNVESKEEALVLATRFMALHAEILGPSYENDAEVLRLYDMSTGTPR
jgi:hypothetical protein